MRPSFWFVLLALGPVACAPPVAIEPEYPPDEAAVVMTVQKLFDAMAAKDVEAARQLLDPEGSFVSVRQDDTGAQVVRRSPFASFLQVLEGATGSYLERMWDAEVRVDGPIAMVWAPYDFYLGGEFSHCGIDLLELLRSEKGWIITGGIYTVRRTGCPESPLGPPDSF